MVAKKWWQRKEHAYVEIIDALYDLIQYCGIKREDYGQGTGFSEEREAEFKEAYNQAYWKIKKATDIGAFVVSSRAEEILKELRNRPRLEWNNNPPFEIWDQEYEYHQDALNKIVSVAKNDLKAVRD